MTLYQNSACSCMGPKNGEPKCPCEMRALGIFQRDGRWIQPEKDLGPVRKVEPFGAPSFDIYSKS